MKKTFFVALVLFSAFVTCLAQSNTPIAVTSAFNKKFPNAINVKWDKENAHEYEATFEWQGVNYSANFSDTGDWLETESSFSFDLLPVNVKTAFASKHKGATIKAVAKIETSKGETRFEVEFKHGFKTVEILYDIDGIEIN